MNLDLDKIHKYYLDADLMIEELEYDMEYLCIKNTLDYIPILISELKKNQMTLTKLY